MSTARFRIVTAAALVFSLFFLVKVPALLGAEAPKVTPLTDQVCQGGWLIITGENNNTFDQRSAVVFKLANNKPQRVPPTKVSRDGRTLLVQVPMGAQDGEVSIKHGATETKVNLQIDPPYGEQYWWLYQTLYFLMAFTPVGFFICFLTWLFRSLRRDQRWRLSEALSEQIEDKSLLLDNGKPVLKDGKEPVYVVKTIYTNSSSRLIALIGLFVIITWVLALALPLIYRFARYGEIADLSNLSTFLLAQAGIFTPYIVSKFTYIFTRPRLTDKSQKEEAKPQE
jgi:hypothetical protein